MSIKSFLRSVYKEPLLYFLLISAALFYLYDVNYPKQGNSDSNNIVVSEIELNKYIQYRRRAFSPRGSQSGLAKLSEAELQKLIDRYIREQVL